MSEMTFEVLDTFDEGQCQICQRKVSDLTFLFRTLGMKEQWVKRIGIELETSGRHCKMKELFLFVRKKT